MTTKLGRYEIVETLGTGSMGTVSRAHDTLLDRDVALKTIRTGSDVDPEMRERFYREARACARLQHPSIVFVYDTGDIDSTAFIAMELLVGSDLRKVIETKAPIPLPAKLQAMIAICQGLGQAHKQGITHRDIKPSNLFLTEAGGAKILDFGIAKLPSSQLTVAGKILGTPNYMAPEQILMKPTGPRSDMFSAAVVFFEFLVHQHPFRTPHGRLITTRIAADDPDSLFDHDTRLPILLNKILQRAMAKDPEDRYRTCDDFAEDLKAVLDSVNNNASPSFELQLPSDRVPVGVAVESTPDPAFAPDPSLLKPAPKGEEEHEWNLSEVLRLIPEFENAVDCRDTGTAKRLFTQLVTIQSVDGRFAEAVELCRTKLGILDRQPEVPPEPEPGHNSNPDTIWDDSTIIIPKPAPSRPTQLSTPPPPAREPSFSGKQKQAAILVAGALAVIVLLAVGYRYLTKPVPVEPSIATALVGAAKSGLVANPGEQPVLVELVVGQKLNILKLPGTATQEWIQAQFVPTPSDASKPGFIRLIDLDPRSWNTAGPQDQLTLIRMFHAGGSPGGEPERAALGALIEQFPESQAARDASNDLIRFDLERLKSEFAAGTDTENLRLKLADLSGNVGDDPSLRELLDQFAKELDEKDAAIVAPLPVKSSTPRLQKPTSVPPPGPGVDSGPPTRVQPTPSVSELLSEADRLLQIKTDLVANRRKAKSLIDQALVSEPGNQRAVQLKTRVEALLLL